VLAGEGTQMAGLKLAEQLRDSVAGLQLHMNAGGGSFKTQFRRADRSGAAIALVVGEQELANGRVGIKYLREDRSQEEIEMSQLAEWLRNFIAP